MTPPFRLCAAMGLAMALLIAQFNGDLFGEVIKCLGCAGLGWLFVKYYVEDRL